MELTEYLKIIHQKKWFLLFILVISVGLSILYNEYIRTPEYEADGKLLFLKDSGKKELNDFSIQDQMLQSFAKSDPIVTQLEIIRTRPVFKKVIDKLQLTNGEGDLITPGALEGMLTFKPIPRTNLISITCIHKNPVLAAEIVNTLTEVFVNKNKSFNKESAGEVKKFIEDQLVQMKQNLTQAEEALVAFQNKIGSISLQEKSRQNLSVLTMLRSELVTIDTDLNGLIAVKKSMEKNISQPNARSRSLYSSWQNTLSQVKTEINELQAKRSNINRNIYNTSALIRQLPPQQKEYANLISNRDIAKQVYTNFLSKLEDFKIQEAATMTNVKIIEPASIPGKPAYPNKMRNILIGIIIGIIFGMAIILLANYFDNTARSIEDIKKVMPYDIMGYIPFINGGSKLFIKENPYSMHSDALRFVQSNMKFNDMMNRNNTSLMLTSALPSEGKTLLSINLALAYASSGKRVALINLDLRRPAFDKYFSREFETGVVDYLILDAEIDDICYYDANLNITIITSGTLPEGSEYYPTNLLSSNRMIQLVDILKSKFDILVIDTPPVNLIAETLDIARHIDNIMLVVDSSKTSMKELNEMNNIINGKNLNIVGMVMNNFGKGNLGYQSSYTKSIKKYSKNY